MTSIGDFIDDGDMETYDATLSTQKAHAYAEHVSDWYNDGAEARKIRLVLVLTFNAAYHIVYNLVYRSRQGNKSGTTLTTNYNGFCNMFINRFAYMKILKTLLTLYNNLTRGKYFGDDKNLSVHPSIADRFNNFTFAEAVASIGMRYTSSDKLSDLQLHRSINDITFLKRRFIKSEFGLYRAPLPKDLILEIPRWSECDPSRMPDQLNRFNSSLLEMSHYGPSEFTEYREFIVQLCKGLQQDNYSIDYTKLFSYQYCCFLMYPRYYPRPYELMDLAMLREQEVEVVPLNRPNCKVLKLLNTQESFVS
jgi:hypothetical protein